jgi:hypothetical protein
MMSRLPLVLLTALLGACAAERTQTADRCLYVLEFDFGRQTKWGSCTSPPPCAIERIEGDAQVSVGPGCK